MKKALLWLWGGAFYALLACSAMAIEPQTSLERCLAGQVRGKWCQKVIYNYWQHNEAIAQAARAYGLDPALLRAVAASESQFNASAKSPVGARGLVQVMPATGQGMGIAPEHLWDVNVNLHGGAYYLAKMYLQFHGDWVKAIAAYNAGPAAVARHGGIPPYPETQAYVRKVLRLYTLFARAEG